MPYKKVFSISFIALAIPFVLLLFGSSEVYQKKESLFKTDIDEHILCQNPKMEHGIILDSFNLATRKIRWNQNLAGILEQYNLGDYTINDVIREVDEVFDVTRFKAYNRYFIYTDKYDSTKRVNYFVYEHTPTTYVKVTFGKTLSAQKLEKETRLEKKTCSGTIHASLWETMLKNDVNPVLAIELSEIYAWSINFFGLEAGDQFKVVYEEEFVDSTSIGIKEILTASFTHRGETFFAIPFVQDSVRSFYDLDGNSLQREFLKAPLRFSRISSGYTLSRMHPILKYRRPHRGIDYAAPAGTPIHAIGDGVVVEKGYSKGAGYYIKIRHNSVYTSGYNHLSGYGKGMRRGVKVKQGDVIGYVGSTGYSTGPHLDFRFWKNGYPINPLKVEAPPVKPVKSENLEVFEKEKQNWLKVLNQITT
jgi:murein DD-endopeptidase MepM/ murein hydrolase activator NlpD